MIKPYEITLLFTMKGFLILLPMIWGIS